MSNPWDSYTAQFGVQPKDATQLMNFSKQPGIETASLDFHAAREMFNARNTGSDDVPQRSSLYGYQPETSTAQSPAAPGPPPTPPGPPPAPPSTTPREDEASRIRVKVVHLGVSYKWAMPDKASNSLEMMRRFVEDKFGVPSGGYRLHYTDEDGDNSVVATQLGLEEAIEYANKGGKLRFNVVDLGERAEPPMPRVEQKQQAATSPNDEGTIRAILRAINLEKFATVLDVEGWDDPSSWNELTDEMLGGFGFRSGHIGKFRKYLAATYPSVEEKEAEMAEVPLFGGGLDDAKVIIGIVLLGETGAGKSTFKQALIDRALRKPFANIHDTERNDDVKEGESQTKDVTVLEVTGPDYILRIVDTPGIGDTVGVAADNEHIENITKFLSEDCVINCICMILQNGKNRATARLSYIVNEIKTNLTHDVWPHVFTVITRSPINRFPGTDTCTVIKLLGLPGPKSENKFFRIDNYAYEMVSEDERPPGYITAKERAYAEGAEQLDLIIFAAGSLDQVTGRTIGELRLHRHESKAKAKELQVTTSNILLEEQRVTDTEEELLKQKNLADLHANFETLHPFKQLEERTMPDGRKCTICAYSGCNNRCHDPCNVRVEGIVTGCAAFGSDKVCMHCHHHMEHHTHTKTYFVETSVMKPLVNEASRELYLKAGSIQEAQSLIREQSRLKLEELANERKSLAQQIGRINAEIGLLSVVNYNEFFPKYIDELMDNVKRKSMSTRQRTREIEALQLQLDEYEAFKEGFSEVATDRSSWPTQPSPSRRGHPPRGRGIRYHPPSGRGQDPPSDSWSEKAYQTAMTVKGWLKM